MEYLDWHPDGNIIAVSDANGRIQCYDSCLSCIHLQPLTEETKPSALLDMQTKVGNKNLVHMKWMSFETAKHPVNQSDAILHLVFEKYKYYFFIFIFDFLFHIFCTHLGAL